MTGIDGQAPDRSPRGHRVLAARAARAYLVGGLAASAAVLAIPPGITRDVVYEVVAASCVVAILIGAGTNRPRSRVAWYLLAVGTSLWVAGDAVSSWYQDVLQVSSFPSPADALYLPAYPVLAAALLTMVRRDRSSRRSSTAFVDSTIVTVGIALLWTVLLVIPTWSGTDGSTAVRLVATAYPIGDVLLLGVLVRIAWSRADRPAAGTTLMVGFVVLLVADTLYDASGLVPAIAAHVDALDPLWLATYVLWGATALHPSMPALADPDDQPPARLRARNVVALAAVAMVCPGLVAWELLTGQPLQLWPVIAASTAMIGLLAVRIMQMVRDLQNHALRLDRLAGTDFVTGLMNRQRFLGHLGELLADRSRPGTGLVVVDLDRFTEINNVLGHQTGDAILRGVGGRLLEVAGDAGVVARLGGDTFAVLCPRITADTEVLPVTTAMLDLLQRPYDLPGVTVAVEARIGVVRLTDSLHDPQIALTRADAAVSAAKMHPDRVVAYDNSSSIAESHASMLAGELPRALQDDEVILHYQPQVSVQDGRVLAVEALARWQHPQLGLLGPDLFIGPAEQTGLIGPFTLYVLDLALAQSARWRRDGRGLTVAVNLSARNLLDPHLVDDVRAALDRHGLPASALELEITESAAMVDPRRSLHALDALDRMGVTLSIDDFGTGHSSLAYLHQLPVRRLKIDRSFVTHLLTDAASVAIVRSTIELARALHLDVVAEGVEDDSTLLRLRDLHCHSAQGFGLGRPVPGDEILDLVTRIERHVPGLLDGTHPMPRRQVRSIAAEPVASV